jgi:tripartite ATP-independent transporter DctP family solute receptor
MEENMRNKKLFSLGLALLLSCALVAVPMQALAAKTLKLAHLNNEDPFDNATGAMAAVFKSLVEAGTNGSVEVQLFSSGQLGKDKEVLQQVKAGIVQSTIATSGGMASIYPLIGVLDIPFAFPNISATYTVLDGPFGEKLSADINAKTGLKVLGFGDSGGFFAFTNSKRPVKSPADMKGLKIRTMGLETHRTMGLETHKTLVSSIGGQPVSLPWAEVYTSLQTGVADGQMNPVPIIKFAKFDEVQKYLTLSGHLFAPYPWVVNQKFYDSLTDQEKDVVNYAAKSAIVAGRGISRIIEASERGLPALAKKMEIYSPTPAEKAMFREAAVPAVKAYIVEALGKEGEEMLNAFLAEVEKAN